MTFTSFSAVGLLSAWLTGTAVLAGGQMLATDAGRMSGHADWAPTPPMGWNSYDAYNDAITEQQFRAAVDVLAAKLRPYGYEYAVIDYGWYNPGPAGWNPEQWHGFPAKQTWNADGTYEPKLAMDEFGRFVPAPNRFPSVAGGVGFKPLADYVHAKGMKFGIHIIRGIPRQAVPRQPPHPGTPYRADDIADRVQSCEWNSDMYGVDMPESRARRPTTTRSSR